ncbi:hypothetical protein [Streptomyces sp. NPDC059743]|uniref:hypothetical protein n=1 Tax=Streptomyces sp. NPDC059743 TaxID=3346928 RepID=UPI0036544904
MDLQTGVRIYQFVRDRQDDLRNAQHPGGHDAYVQSWRDAHGLSQDYATAVQADDVGEAGRFLSALVAMADQWKSHPDYPVLAGQAPGGTRADPESRS